MSEPTRQQYQDEVKAFWKGRCDQLQADNKRLRERLDAVEELNVCYRLGRQPSEKLHRKLEKTKQALKEKQDE